MKKIIKEGYKEIDELNLLATDIIINFANKNYPMIARIQRGGEYYFNNDMISIDDMIFDKEKYKILKNFISDKNDPIVIIFDKNIRNSNFDNQHNIIRIKYDNEFNELINYYIKNTDKNPEDNTISTNDKIRILKTAIGVVYRSDIIHELQHAYDFFISNKKYNKNKKSLNYYSKYKDYFKDQNIKITPEQYKEYLDLPHEYWARFSEFISDTYIFKNKPFDNILDKFKKSTIIRYYDLNQNSKKKLIKALYKYWYLKQN